MTLRHDPKPGQVFNAYNDGTGEGLRIGSWVQWSGRHFQIEEINNCNGYSTFRAKEGSGPDTSSNSG